MVKYIPHISVLVALISIYFAWMQYQDSCNCGGGNGNAGGDEVAEKAEQTFAIY